MVLCPDLLWDDVKVFFDLELNRFCDCRRIVAWVGVAMPSAVPSPEALSRRMMAGQPTIAGRSAASHPCE